MSHNIKKFISNTIDEKDIISEKLNKEELISLALYFVYKKEYFQNSFDTMYIRSNYEGEIRLVSAEHNDVKGASRRNIGTLVCSVNDDRDDAINDMYFFERPEYDEYFFMDMTDEEVESWVEPTLKNDIKYLNDKTIKNILSFVDLFDKSQNSNDLISKIENTSKNNPDIIFDFYIHMSSITRKGSPLFDFLNNNVKLEELRSDKHQYLLPFSKKKGIQFFKFGSKENFDFIEEKNKIMKDFKQKIKEIKRLSPVIKDNKKALSEIMNSVNDRYPDLDLSLGGSKAEDLDYFYFEVPADKQTEHEKIAIPKSEQLHHSDMFKEHDLNISSFFDFVLENPFEINRENLFSNALQGLVYINKETLQTNRSGENMDYSFIVAKTKRNETAGVISLAKYKDSNKVYKISDISIKNNFRNKGVASHLYKKIAEFCIFNELVLTNKIYSKEGEQYLPKMKQKIKDNNPDFMLIDRNLSGVYDEIESTKLFEEYHKRVLRHISEKDRKNGFDFKAAVSAYHKGFNKIKDEMVGVFANYEDMSKAFNEFETEYDKLENKNKKNKKRIKP